MHLLGLHADRSLGTGARVGMAKARGSWRTASWGAPGLVCLEDLLEDVSRISTLLFPSGVLLSLFYTVQSFQDFVPLLLDFLHCNQSDVLSVTGLIF